MDTDQLRRQLTEKYTLVATNPKWAEQFHQGRDLARMLEYEEEWIEALPRASIESFAGSGNPFSMGRLAAGETVLDLGCGAGVDSLIAARLVGPSGKVTGIDMTPAMLEKARGAATQAEVHNVEFLHGYAEAIPMADACVDVVISNGVINLCPDKGAVLSEIHRVLKAAGRVQISDIVARKRMTDDAKANIDLWGSCISGALLEAEWVLVLERSGFSHVRFGKQVDIFRGTQQEASAAVFDTRGISIAATKA